MGRKFEDAGQSRNFLGQTWLVTNYLKLPNARIKIKGIVVLSKESLGNPIPSASKEFVNVHEEDPRILMGHLFVPFSGSHVTINRR